MSRSSALRRERRESVDLVAAWGAAQGLLAVSPEFTAFIETFAPSLGWKASAYAERTWIQLKQRDDDDDEHDADERWICRRRGVDLRRALAASWTAGRTNEPESIDGRTEIVAVHLAYLPSERVKFVSLDLDGQTPPLDVIRAIRGEIGDAALLVTSGSGRAGRYRVLLRLAQSKTVEALQSLVKRWLAGLGLEVRQGAIDVFPSTKCGRKPFGLGGCERFSLDLDRSVREKPIDLWRVFAGLKPIDLRALAKRYPALPEEPMPAATAPRNLTGLPRSVSKARLPRREVGDRRPPTPKHIRELWKNGVQSKGERDKAIYDLAVDCRYRRFSLETAIERIREWINDGKINQSRAALSERGKNRELRDVERRVRDVYKTHLLPGRPEPVALTAGEGARIGELATNAAVAGGFSESAIRSLLFGILPLFKAAQLAGLRKVRIHKVEWESAAGSRYSKLRDACGIFAMVNGHRSSGSLRDGGFRPEVAAELAYAQSWQTSFKFDL